MADFGAEKKWVGGEFAGRPWKSYFTLGALTRTKTTAQVLHDASEEEKELDGVDASGAATAGGMSKVLTVWDIIAYGVGGTLGAGIFAITSSGCAVAGPAIVLSFILAAVACVFSAFSYMEFAARVPIAGSAYTFTYVCLGELAAWFVGWNLTLEYAISAAVVARTWAQNLELFIENLGGDYPSWITSYSVDADPISSLSLMSALICLICTGILLIGVKESSNFNIFITGLNVSVILFIIILGSFHVDTTNWTKPDPSDVGASATWFPMGGNGIVTGAAVVFFSYIGFDTVTTLAEEVKNPKRDLPIGIGATLLISTALYIATTLVVTGMRPWYLLQDDSAPLAEAFDFVGLKWASTLVSGATVTGLTGSTLTTLFGQPRIFYRMAKDGLIFSPLGKLHPTTRVPLWGTIITGVGAALIAFLIPLDSLSNMISIGTLLAFSTVCAGVVTLRFEKEAPLPGAVAPADETLWKRLDSSPIFWMAMYLLPLIGFCASLRHIGDCPWPVIMILGMISVLPIYRISRLPVSKTNFPKAGNFVCPLVPWLPCLGIFTNCYLIVSLDVFSYVRIVVWTAIGFAIYFAYGIFYSTITEKMARYNKAKQLEADQYDLQQQEGQYLQAGTQMTPLPSPTLGAVMGTTPDDVQANDLSQSE